MSSIRIGFTTLKREYKSGELKLLAWVVLVAVICVCSIAFITNSIKAALENKSGELLGGDKIVSSSYSLDNKLYSIAKNNNLKTAKKIEFNSVVVNNDGAKFALAAIKAVSNNYPLLGSVKLTDQLFANEYEVDTIPELGTVWLEARLMLLLGINIGDTVKIGSAEFVVTNLITYEPDKIGIYAFSPRVLINIKDLPATKVLQPGSRVTYSMQLAGTKNNLAAFEQAIPLELRQNLSIDDPKSIRPSIKRSLDKGNSFLGLCATINLLLAGVAVAVCARSFSIKQVKQVAIMRTFGATQSQIFMIYSSLLFTLAVIVGAAGIVISLALQYFYVGFFKQFLPSVIYRVDGLAIFMGFSTAVVLVLSFGLPRIIQLCKISPISIFQRKIILPNTASLIVYLLCAITIMLFITILIKDFYLLQLFAFSLVGIGGACVLIFKSLLELLEKWRNKFSFSIKFGLNNFFYNKYDTIVQIFSIVIILTTALVLYYVRTDLLNSWQTQLAPNTPNYFAVNITEDILDDYNNYLADNNITSSAIYPIVRGNLIKINNQPVTNGRPKIGARKGLHRSLNLTWSNQYPDGNILLDGKWFSNIDNADKTGTMEISIEKNIVTRLDVGLGDTLTFRIGSEEITAKITSIREANWDSFKPNFYVIYPNGVINTLPHTYMNSFYIPTNKISIANEVIKKFPAVSIIDTSAVLRQVQDILITISNVVVFLWVATLVIGIILFYAVILSNTDDRKKEYKVMRLLGANNRQLLKLFFTEYLSLGVCAALFSLFISQIIVYYISISIFNFGYKVNYALGGCIFIVVIVGVLGVGMLGMRKVFVK